MSDPLSILVVDDNQSMAKSLRDVLELKGFIAYEASSGVEALEILHDHPMDVMVTDVIMPEMDGHELSEHIQALRPNIRILFMSGYPDEVMEQHGHLPAGLLILPKPFSVAVLAQRVRAALDAPATPAL